MKNRVSLKNIIILLVVVLTTLASLFVYRKYEEKKMKTEFMEQLAITQYDSVFFSMYSLENYSSEDFTTYLGTSPILSPFCIKKLSDISDFLDTAFESSNNIRTVYLGIDAEALWRSCQKDNNIVTSNLSQELLSYIANNPDITFEIVLSYPSLDYWTSFSTKKLDSLVETINTLVTMATPFQNVFISFPCAEEWLIANPGNYVTSTETNAFVSQRIMLLTFDHQMLVNQNNIPDVLSKFKSLILSSQNSKTEMPDLSDWHIVFFGDSIFGNYTDSLAIPGVVNGFTGATVHNYGIGGDSSLQFSGTLDAFLNHTAATTDTNMSFPYDEINSTENELCFILHYGLNDYYSGVALDDVENPYNLNTYGGSLRTGIKRLRDAYPNARIIIMTPPFTSYFDFGKEKNSSVGEPLYKYVDTGIAIAKEMNILYLDSYYSLGMNENNYYEYLVDGCHYNEYGRYLTGIRLTSFFHE